MFLKKGHLNSSNTTYTSNSNQSTTSSEDKEGEYIDYEEVK